MTLLVKRAAFAAATGAVIYAVASLNWASQPVSLPRPLAALAIATLVAYVDTVRQLAASAASPHGDIDSDSTEAMR